MLAHNVYFTLEDSSDAARDRLVAACGEHLSGHPGTAHFACGKRAVGLERDVNDLDFDVGLVVVFETRADHDAYQSAEAHQRFIDENASGWKRVRVFDVEG